jgi:hypothetical protein
MFFLMKYSKFLFGFLSVFRTVLFSTNSFLEYFDFLQRFFQVLRICNLFYSWYHNEIFYPKSTPIGLDSENTCLTESFFHLPLKRCYLSCKDFKIVAVFNSHSNILWRTASISPILGSLWVLFSKSTL